MTYHGKDIADKTLSLFSGNLSERSGEKPNAEDPQGFSLYTLRPAARPTVRDLHQPIGAQWAELGRAMSALRTLTRYTASSILRAG